MIISTVGLIFSLLWVYEQMLVAQVAETGITGIVLSLLPSLPLSALGWYVKRRYQRAVTNECSEEQQSTNVTIQSSDTEDEKPLATSVMPASTVLILFLLKVCSNLLLDLVKQSCSCLI